MDLLANTVEAFGRQQELRESWQGRMLAHAEGKTSAVLLSIIADSYDEILLPLLKAVFPGFIEPARPCLVSSARIGHSGVVFAMVLFEDGSKLNTVLYKDEIELRDTFRKLADQAKLTDPERLEMFCAIRRWVVADFRLDPNMDPQDPDAKRLVH